MKIETPMGADESPRAELIPGLVFLLFAVALSSLAFGLLPLSNYGTRLCFAIGAPVLVLAGGFFSVYFTVKARQRGPIGKPTIPRTAPLLHPTLEGLSKRIDKILLAAIRIDWRGDWLSLCLVLSSAALALVFEYRAWKITPGLPSPRADQWLFGLLVAACFPVLVLERRFSAVSERRMLAANALSMLLRLFIANLLFFGLGFLFRWLELGWWLPIDRALMLLTALVSGELFLRAARYFFMPLPPLHLRRGHIDSFVGALLRLERPSLSVLSAIISREIGIDLGRSWALGFVRRSTLPALIILGFAGWLMTGLTALSISQRAVYEVLGAPKAVFHSGLHFHLPWPLGRLTFIEYGIIHEIPIVFPAENGTPSEAAPSPSTDAATIEGPPPQSAERLWDATHPSEASYLVASNRNGRETFEVVNIDLQILYRTGLSDQAAYDWVYNIDSADSLIRAAAGRMLARYFARYTIPDVLGQNREQFIRGFQRELQTRLNALSAGVDILGVVVEAIHPPAGTATAYQEVQAAGIRSEIQVATARGDAARSVLQAQAQAITMRDGAQATSAELINQASRDTALFAGDVVADHQDGAAFLFERRLQAISTAVGPNLPVTIMDSSIPANQMPMLDLRPTGSASTPPTPADTNASGGASSSDDDDQR